jgi:cell division protein FtsN
MNIPIKRRWTMTLQIALLIVAGGLLTVACEQKPSEATPKANEATGKANDPMANGDRWQMSQEDEKAAIASAQAAFEKKQAEKKKAAETKTDANAKPSGEAGK